MPTYTKPLMICWPQDVAGQHLHARSPAVRCSSDAVTCEAVAAASVRLDKTTTTERRSHQGQCVAAHGLNPTALSLSHPPGTVGQKDMLICCCQKRPHRQAVNCPLQQKAPGSIQTLQEYAGMCGKGVQRSINASAAPAAAARQPSRCGNRSD